jgi:hypothetical protein
MADDVHIGTRVCLTVHLPDYSCTGTVIDIDDCYYIAIKDGHMHDNYGAWATGYHRDWAVLPDQTPNPEHTAVVAEYRRGRGRAQIRDGWNSPKRGEITDHVRE